MKTDCHGKDKSGQRYHSVFPQNKVTHHRALPVLNSLVLNYTTVCGKRHCVSAQNTLTKGSCDPEFFDQ